MSTFMKRHSSNNSSPSSSSSSSSKLSSILLRKHNFRFNMNELSCSFSMVYAHTHAHSNRSSLKFHHWDEWVQVFFAWLFIMNKTYSSAKPQRFSLDFYFLLFIYSKNMLERGDVHSSRAGVWRFVKYAHVHALPANMEANALKRSAPA